MCEGTGFGGLDVSVDKGTWDVGGLVIQEVESTLSLLVLVGEEQCLWLSSTGGRFLHSKGVVILQKQCTVRMVLKQHSQH